MTLVVERGASKWLRPARYEGQPSTARSGADKTRPLPWDNGGRRKHRDRYQNPKPKRKKVNPLFYPPLEPKKFRPPHPDWWRNPVFGKRLPKRLPRINPLWEGPDTYLRPTNIPLIPWKNPHPVTLPNNDWWYLYSECSAGPPSNWNGFVRGPRTNDPGGTPCIAGQSIGGGPPGGDIQISPLGELLAGSYRIPGRNGASGYTGAIASFWYQYEITPGVLTRHRHQIAFRRVANVSVRPDVDLDYVPWHALPPEPNPNDLRPLPSLMPELDVQAALDLATETQTETQPMTKAVSFSSTGVKQPVRPVRRKPPRRSSKHKKSLTTAKWLGPLLFGALDLVSEYSEIVGAIYDSLPKHIKDQYEQPGRGLTDQAGQYGVDGVDWKAEALWDHWDKIDPEKAVKNIINNVAQDALLGLLHKNLPVNNGQAFDGAFQWINETLEKNLFLK